MGYKMKTLIRNKLISSSFFVRDLALSAYAKIFRKINLSNPLICSPASPYQAGGGGGGGARNASFSENIAYVLTKRSLIVNREIGKEMYAYS